MFPVKGKKEDRAGLQVNSSSTDFKDVFVA